MAAETDFPLTRLSLCSNGTDCKGLLVMKILNYPGHDISKSQLGLFEFLYDVSALIQAAGYTSTLFVITGCKVDICIF